MEIINTTVIYITNRNELTHLYGIFHYYIAIKNINIEQRNFVSQFLFFLYWITWLLLIVPFNPNAEQQQQQQNRHCMWLSNKANYIYNNNNNTRNSFLSFFFLSNILLSLYPFTKKNPFILYIVCFLFVCRTFVTNKEKNIKKTTTFILVWFVVLVLVHVSYRIRQNSTDV